MMKRIFVSSLSILLFCSISWGQAGYTKSGVFVKIKNTPAGISTNNNDPIALTMPGSYYLLSKYKVDTFYEAFPNGPDYATGIFRVEFSAGTDIDKVVSELRMAADVVYAERIPVATFSGAQQPPSELQKPNSFNSNYFTRIGIDESWSYLFLPVSSDKITIAVIDNAIRVNHEDLKDSRWINPGDTSVDGKDDDLNGYVDDVYGVDISNHDGDPTPPAFNSTVNLKALQSYSHGTHVAGIACAVTNNNIGIPSLGFNANLMSIKIVPDNLLYEANIDIEDGIEGINYAINHGADIINISWCSDLICTPLEEAINAALHKGIVVIAAAGNLGKEVEVYPAAYEGVITVGATFLDDKIWTDIDYSLGLPIPYGSNYGANIDVMAPGTNVYSLFAQNDYSYDYETGTSMASPLVAGFASLILSLNPGMKPADVATWMKAGCDNIDKYNPGFEHLMGVGRINIDRTLNLIATSTGKPIHRTESVNIFPNPSNGTFSVSFQGDAMHKYTISVCDLQGREVYSETGNKTAEDLRIQIPEMEKGLYLVRLQTGDQSLLVQRIAVY